MIANNLIVVLVFEDGELAGMALLAFTSEAEFYDGEPEKLAFRSAKPHPQKGDSNILKVRVARQNDRKVVSVSCIIVGILNLF